MGARVLVVDDVRATLETVEFLLRDDGFDPMVLQSGREALERMGQLSPDIVLTNIRLAEVSGLDILDTVHERDAEVPVILMTVRDSLQSAVTAVNQGAFYYLQKPFNGAELLALCRRAAEARDLTRENKALKQEIRRRDRAARTGTREPTPLVSARPPANPSLEVIERAYIMWVLQAESGNKARAAEVLGIDPSTLYRKLNRYGLAE